MNDKKARFIVYFSYEAYRMMMLAATRFEEIETSNLPVEKKTILILAGHISYEILYPLYKKYPKIKDEMDYLENVLQQDNNEKNGQELTIKTIAFLVAGAFSKLGGTMIPHFFSENDDMFETEIKQAIIDQSERIIVDILNPIFVEYPDIKQEVNLLFNQIGRLPF